MDTSTVALIGLAVTLAKIVEKLIDLGYNKFKKPEDDSTECKMILKEMHAMIKTISELTSRVDINGLPMVFFPRNIESRQLESLNLLNDASHSQINVTKILDKLTDKVIDIDKKQDQVLYEVRKK